MTPKKMVVITAVADLRKEPKPRALDRKQDFDQETQLLFGEHVLAYEEKDGWVSVEAVEQQEFTHNHRWEGYPGWVQRKALVEVAEFPRPNAVVIAGYAALKKGTSFFSGRLAKLSLGTRLVIVEAEKSKKGWSRVLLADGRRGWVRTGDIRMLSDLPFIHEGSRSSIVDTARRFLGGPYFWGGRSFYDKRNKKVMTGVDCSGLVYLSYRINGLDVPRDAHEQFLKSRRIEAKNLKPGDLIFLSTREDPENFSHVMIYAGDGKIIEAAGEKDGVRETTLKERLGVTPESLGWGDRTELYRVYFGTYIPE
ncbi:MAG: C40 family peptidase [Elusimicrobia bacterium]|nr:C40 family peptidase [Elusimicrobiota bacterium]